MTLVKQVMAWKGVQKLGNKHCSQRVYKYLLRRKRGLTEEGKFPRAVFRKDLGINSVLCQVCKCWVHSSDRGVRVKLKHYSKFKCQSRAN